MIWGRFRYVKPNLQKHRGVSCMEIYCKTSTQARENTFLSLNNRTIIEQWEHLNHKSHTQHSKFLTCIQRKLRRTRNAPMIRGDGCDKTLRDVQRTDRKKLRADQGDQNNAATRNDGN